MTDQSDSTGKKEKKTKVIIASAIFAIVALAATIVSTQMFSAALAQTDDTDDEDGDESTISTSGTATTKVKPDKVSIMVGVETDGVTASEAATKNAELMDKVMMAFKELNITDDQMSTSYYSLYPVYEYQYPPCILEGSGEASSNYSGTDPSTGTIRPEIYPPPPECQPKNVITGYKASNSLTVTLEADANVGQVIDAAVQAGANNISGVYFFVSQEIQEQIQEDLIDRAIANAENRASKAAAAIEMEITGVRSINLNDAYFPIFEKSVMADSGIAGSPPTQILPGEQEISMTVSVTFIIG